MPLSALPCHAVINPLFMLLTHLMTVFLVQPQEAPRTTHGKSYLSLIFMAFHSNSQG